MIYTITVRDDNDEKIATRIEVEDTSTTIQEIIEQGKYETRREKIISKWLRDHKKAELRYFWFPELIPVPPPPPPKPQPIDFDVLVDMCMV